MCSRLGLNKDNENFIDFLSSDIGAKTWETCENQGKHAFDTYQNEKCFL